MPRASLRDRVSKTQFAWGSTKAACHFKEAKMEGKTASGYFAFSIIYFLFAISAGNSTKAQREAS